MKVEEDNTEVKRHTVKPEGEKPKCLVRWEELQSLMKKAKLFAIVLGGKNGFTKEMTKNLGEQLKAVIVLEVSERELHCRMNNVRLNCSNLECGNVFSKFGEKAPKREGKCDYYGAELFVREDETPESLKRRWEIYFDETVRALEYLGEMGYTHFEIGNNKGEAAGIMSPVIFEFLL